MLIMDELCVVIDESEEAAEGESDSSSVYHVAPEVHFSSAKMMR